MQALAMGTFAVVVQIVVPATLALAASGTSAGVAFTVTAPGNGAPVGGTVSDAVTGLAAPRATTGRGAPIPSQPRFTG